MHENDQYWMDDEVVVQQLRRAVLTINLMLADEGNKLIDLDVVMEPLTLAFIKSVLRNKMEPEIAELVEGPPLYLCKFPSEICINVIPNVVEGAMEYFPKMTKYCEERYGDAIKPNEEFRCLTYIISKMYRKIDRRYELYIIKHNDGSNFFAIGENRLDMYYM